MQRREPMDTMERAREAAEDVQQDAATKAREMKERMRTAADEASRKARDVGERTMERSRAATEEVRSFVRNHPLASLAIGLGAGVLVSQILRRRR